jgi:hypothetical protein
VQNICFSNAADQRQQASIRLNWFAMYGTTLPYLVTDADRKEFGIASQALTPEMMQHVFGLVRANEHKFYIAPCTLVQAIDPTTGDSLLHVAVRAGSMDGVVSLMARFDRAGQRRFYRWARHAFIAHQNHHGDTVFHVASRSGNLKLIIMLYRFIDCHWSAPHPDVEDEDAPENEVYPFTASEDSSSPRLMLLITKNRGGRDAAAEARLVGNDEIAEWFDAVADKLDPKGTRRAEEGISDMMAIVKELFWYDLMRERQQKSSMSS